MQGFNMGRYRPPDDDPTKVAFNRDRHPLGVRAKKIHQGILVVRFELPFNVWCGGCNNHIGQGVRYNAEKKHVDDYHSTKVWSFRCKCHLCSHWFEIRTDPKNARYVVHDGARQQHQDWNPEENGGHPIYDDTASPSSSAPVDAFSALEKRTTDLSKAQQRTQRILDLEAHSDARWSDPYTLNAKLRTSFRREKRKRTEQLLLDLDLKERIGWHEEQVLLPPDAAVEAAEDGGRSRAEEQWREERLEAQQKRLCAGGAALEYRGPSSSLSSSSSRLEPAPAHDATHDATRTAVASPSLPSLKKPRKAPTSSPKGGKRDGVRHRLSTGSATASPVRNAPDPRPRSSAALESLRTRLIANTRKRQDPFLQQLRQNLPPR